MGRAMGRDMGTLEAGKIDGQSFEYRLQHLPVGVVVLDGDRRVLSANDAGAKTAGLG